MLSDEEKQTIEYLKSRLYENQGCKFIDVAQSELRIFLKLVENLQKDIKSWKKYCDEQENDITLKNNKICDLEFKIEKQSKEIEELKETLKCTQNSWYEDAKIVDKIKAKIEELQKEKIEMTVDIFNHNTLAEIIRDEQINILQSLLEKE